MIVSLAQGVALGERFSEDLFSTWKETAMEILLLNRGKGEHYHHCLFYDEWVPFCAQDNANGTIRRTCQPGRAFPCISLFAYEILLLRKGMPMHTPLRY